LKKLGFDDQNAARALAATVSAPAAIMIVPVPEVARRSLIRSAVEHEVRVDMAQIDAQVDNDPTVVPIPISMPVIGVCGHHGGRPEEKRAQPQYRHSMQNVRFHCLIGVHCLILV
jgi:hypothetical protein